MRELVCWHVTILYHKDIILFKFSYTRNVNMILLHRVDEIVGFTTGDGFVKKYTYVIAASFVTENSDDPVHAV